MSKPKKHKIIFTGGGTGGHIFPLIAIIRELKKILPKETLSLSYIGPRDPISKEYMEKEGIEIRYISTGKVRRYGGFMTRVQDFLDIVFRIPLGIMQSFLHIYIISPDLIFSKGGHGSFPIVVMGKFFNIPLLLHESDAVLGATNKLLQKFFAEIFTSFPKTEGVNTEKMLIVGNPIREEVLQGSKEKGIELFKLKGEKPVIVIIGGSQGSERINDLFLSALTGFLQDFQIIHQCGENNHKTVFAESNAIINDEKLKENYHLFAFFDEEKLKHAYKCADLIVSRAGSGSIFEIAANNKAAIFLPLNESAQNHQLRNAYLYASTKSAVVLEDTNLTSRFFLSKIKELFSPIKQIRVMEENSKYFARPRAGGIIAAYIKEYLTRND